MIIFRADGNSKIGSGHIMRCLSLADGYAKDGNECVFVVADDSFYQTIIDRGYDCIVLKTNYFNMEEELPEFEIIINGQNVEKIIIDSYFVTKKYLCNLKRYAEIQYIDDLMSFAYPVDCLMNYNVFANEKVYIELYEREGLRVPKLLIGPKYAPLREQFLGICPIVIKDKARNIFVSTGGADNEHISLGIIDYILNNFDVFGDYVFHLVVGSANLDLEEIKKRTEKLSSVVVHSNVKEMAELMRSCDIAISAAGSTLYELCACGVPTITYVLADNQIPAAIEFSRDNIMSYIGDFRYNDNFYTELFNKLKEIADDYNLRKQYSKNMISVLK